MSKTKEELFLVGELRKLMPKIENYVGGSVAILMDDKQQAKWYDLEKEYEAFYELSIQERLYRTGMATRPESEQS